MSQKVIAQPAKRTIVDAQVHLWKAESEDWKWVPGMKPQLPEPFMISDIINHGLAFLDVHNSQAALKCRQYIVRIGNLLAVAVGNFDCLLIIRVAVQERNRLLGTLGRVAVAVHAQASVDDVLRAHSLGEIAPPGTDVSPTMYE